MLSLTKKTDYAMIALGYLAERPGQVVSAREVATRFRLPMALVMNILKTLQHKGMLTSIRGTKGGYQLSASIDNLTLYDLILALEGPIQLTDCIEPEDPQGMHEGCKVSCSCPVQAPLQALHLRLVRFLKEVKLSDVLVPGHRIDVPVELVGVT